MPEKCGLSPQATHGKGIVGGLHAASHKMVAILPLLVWIRTRRTDYLGSCGLRLWSPASAKDWRPVTQA